MKKALAIGVLFASCATVSTPEFDLVVRHGTIIDGSGAKPFVGDVAVVGDKIVAVGVVAGSGRTEIDARGRAIAPGFINVLSWASDSLLVDPRALSDVRQGVTLEVFGEGESMGPLNAKMKAQMLENQGDLKFEIAWTTLGEYLEHLEHLRLHLGIERSH